MRCALAFSRSVADHLLVTLEIQEPPEVSSYPKISVTSFKDENDFIQQTVLAMLDDKAAIDILAAVLKFAAERTPANSWTFVELSETALYTLGLLQDSPVTHIPAVPLGHAADLTGALLQAPLALALLNGPDHLITFANAACAKMLGFTQNSWPIGKEIRTLITQPEKQSLIRILDSVYQSGELQVGVDFRSELYNEESGSAEESYFDFVLHPLKDLNNATYGILCLATDVTDRFVSTSANGSTESQLYRHCSELSAIYNKSPIGLCVFDIEEFRILRVNGLFAQFLGTEQTAATGQVIGTASGLASRLKTLLEWVVDGQSIDNYEMSVSWGGEHSIWLLNISPIVDSFGKVEGLAASALDITDRSQDSATDTDEKSHKRLSITAA